MDIYTTTFTLSCHTHLHSRHHEHHNNNNNAAGQHDSNASFDDDATIPSLTTSSSTRSLGSLDGIAETAAEKEEAVITVCKDVAVREGCVITASKVEIQHVESDNPASGEVTASKQGDKWMVNISGPQTSVLAAKSAILCELADDKTATLKAKRFDLLDSPFRYSSPVRPHIKARLDSIADTTHTVITIPNDRSPNNDRAPNQYLYHSAQHDDADIGSDHDVPSTPILKPSQASEGIRHVSAGSMSTHSLNRSFGQHRRSVSSIGQSHRSFGSIESLVVPANGDVTFENPDVIPCHGNLEPEKNIEIMIEGRGQAVDLARVRVLVMLDEIAGLHAQSVIIFHKLHSILAGRRHAAIQAIQEGTGTKIYLSSAILYPVDRSAATQYQKPNSVHPLGLHHTGFHSMPSATGHLASAYDPAASPYSAYHNHMHQGHPHSTHPDPSYAQYRHTPYQSYHPGAYPYPQQHMPHYPHPYHSAMRNGWATPDLGMPHHVPSAFASRESVASLSSFSPDAQASNLWSGSPSSYVSYGTSPMYADCSPGQGLFRFQQQQLPAVPLNGHTTAAAAGHGEGQPRSHLGAAPTPIDSATAMATAPQRQGSFQQQDTAQKKHERQIGSLGYLNNEVWITGEHAAVLRAIGMLKHLEAQKAPRIMSREVTTLPRRLDWLLHDQIEVVRTILYNNGTCLQVPPSGTQLGLFTIHGDNRSSIERTIKQVMALTCQFVTAALWLLPRLPDESQLLPLDHNKSQPIISEIGNMTGAAIVSKDVGFEVYGAEEQVKRAVMAINDIDMIQHVSREMRFYIELANEHREFISGKKNGKISKIVKTANVKIKLEPPKEYTFVLELSGAIPVRAPGQQNGAKATGVFAGLQLLLDEMPAELSFHVPESHHKRIIGVQGKTIQAIMKDLGVYVKFSSADEHAMLGGYDDNEDNVIARTPRKNTANLERLKKAIMDLVLVKDRDYIKMAIDISASYHRQLYSDKQVIVRDIERKTGAQIRFPPSEAGVDAIVVYGPKGQLDAVRAMIMEHVPVTLEMRVESNDRLLEVTASNDFIAFVEHVKRERRTAISIVPSDGNIIIQFKCPCSAGEQPEYAKDALANWLADHNVNISGSPKRSQILLQQVRPASRVSSTTPSLSFDAKEHIRTRPASTTNVQALFDGNSPNRFTMPLAALKNGASPDRGFLTMSGHTSVPSAPPTATMWHHATSHSIGGLPFMSASMPFYGRPDVLKRQQSLALLETSALGLQTLSSPADDLTPKPSQLTGRVATPPHIPVPAQMPVSGPRSFGHAAAASIGGLSLVNGDFTPTANDGLHDTTAARTPRFVGGHQRTATGAEPIDRSRYGRLDHVGHQRGAGGRAQSLDITGFDYGRYMRPASTEAPVVAEVENENDGDTTAGGKNKVGNERSRSPLTVVDMPNLAQSFDTFTLSDA